MGGQELIDRSEAFALKLPGNGIGPRGIRIDDANQADGDTFFGKLLIDARVIASEGANSDNSDLDQIIRGQNDPPRQVAAKSRLEHSRGA